MVEFLTVIAALMSNTIIGCGVAYWLGKSGWGKDVMAERMFASFFFWPILIPLMLIHKSGQAGALDGKNEVTMLKADLMHARQEIEDLELRLADVRALPPKTGTYR